MRTPVTPWLIAAIEGFSTLAVEVIAIRLAVPVVGSSVTLTGVMLGIVLLALSAGYWRGGAFSAQWDKARIRTALARNLFLAAALYGGLAFPFEATVLEKLLDAGLSLPLAIGVTAAALFLLPIYLASQTVPLLAELINTEGKAGKASGRILFYSTIGSVAGGIVTPVWLFPSIGVVRSTYVVCAMLAAIATALAIGHSSRVATAAALGVAVIMTVSALVTPSNAPYSFDSPYQSIRIVEEKAPGGRPTRVLIMSGSRSSGIYADTGETFFEYVRACGARLRGEAPAEQALVIGAAGFTFPRDAARLGSVKRVDAIDVDPIVKQVAEQHFLQHQLSPKIRFLPLSARCTHYADSGQTAFTAGSHSSTPCFARGIPEELTTAEFFRDVRGIADRTAANVVMDRDMESPIARNLLATFRQEFGAVWTSDVVPGDDEKTNVHVTNCPAQGSARWNGSGAVYHDDRNSSDHDHVEMIW